MSIDSPTLKSCFRVEEELGDEISPVADRTSEPVEFRDHEPVDVALACPQDREHLIHCRPLEAFRGESRVAVDRDELVIVELAIPADLRLLGREAQAAVGLLFCRHSYVANRT